MTDFETMSCDEAAELRRKAALVDELVVIMESLDRYCLSKQSLADGVKVMDAKNIVRAALKRARGE